MNDDLIVIVQAFIEAVHMATASKLPATGMQVPYHGEFCSANPSVMKDLNWWARQFKQRLPRTAGEDV